MVVRRRIRPLVKKSRRPRLPGPRGGRPDRAEIGVWQALREIDQFLKGIDDALADRRAA